MSRQPAKPSSSASVDSNPAQESQWLPVRVAIRWPRTVLVVMTAITLCAAFGLPRLELRMDGHALVPAEDPAVLFDAEVRQRFGTRDPLIVLIETRHPQGIYNLATLDRVRQLSARLAKLEGVGEQHLTSLATERRDRVYPGTLKFRPLLDPFPDSPELMELFKGDVAAARILEGTLVSKDGNATALFIGVPPGASGDRAAFYRQVVSLTEDLQSADDRILVVGAPAAEALLGDHLLSDLGRLLPLAMALMAAILWWRLRRLWGVVLGLCEVGACLAFTFGLMGWLGSPVYLTTAVLPVVLITLGLADEIHVFYHYQLEVARGDVRPGESRCGVARTLAAMLPPVTLTSITTIVGFLSFAASGIEPLRVFGQFAALGILFCWVWTVSAVPAALVLLGPDRLRARQGAVSHGSAIVRLLAPALRSPGRSLVGLAVLTVVLGAGAARLYVQDSWIEGFAEGSDFRQATERVNQKLHGTHTLQIHLRTLGGDGPLPSGDGKEGWLLAPEILREIGQFETYLRRQPGVGGVLGPHSHLATVAHLWQGRREGTYQIPEKTLTVARVVRYFDVVRGKHRRHEVLSETLDEALITVFLKNANYRQTERLIEQIKSYESRFRSQRIELDLAGDVAVSQAMIPAIVHSQVRSLQLALLGALLTLCCLLRSLRMGLLALAPVVVSVLWTFGVMGWLGMPLGVATSMFCAITLGVGVDYSIHFLAAHRRARRAADEAPIHRALAESGPPIVTDLLAIAGSFGLLLISQVPANARLGGLVAVALMAACLLTLVGLSCWLSWRQQCAPGTAPALAVGQVVEGGRAG